jgi:hypothetical protein
LLSANQFPHPLIEQIDLIILLLDLPQQGGFLSIDPLLDEDLALEFFVFHQGDPFVLGVAGGFDGLDLVLVHFGSGDPYVVLVCP